MTLRLAILLSTIVLCAGCGVDPSPYDPEAHSEEIAVWQVRRLADLVAEDSWLSLVDYHYLTSEVTTMGSGPNQKLQTPRGPEAIGRFLVDDTSVRFLPEAGVEVTVERAGSSDPVPAEGIRLALDDDLSETVFRLGPLSWLVRDFQDRLAVRLRDNESPVRTRFPGLSYFALDPDWRLRARFEAHDPPKRFPVAIYTGGEAIQESPGAVVLDLEGTTYRLDVTDTTDSTYFVIFGDRSNGTETYGAGRYVWFDRPDEDGSVILDLNKAYNPPCVFTDYAACPIPPPAHRLEVAVRAGEQMFDRDAR